MGYAELLLIIMPLLLVSAGLCTASFSSTTHVHHFLLQTQTSALHRKDMISSCDRGHVGFSLKLFSGHYFPSEVNLKVLKNSQIPYSYS